MGHVKYLLGDTAEARDCYERTISFIGDASEMHSIYLRLASIYLQEGRVRIIWASTRKNLTSGVCEYQRRRPACASAQSDQHLCYLLSGKYNI